MALTLSKTNIATGNIITAAEVSQSVDAFTGAVAYDITLSGSLQLTGSVKSRNGYTGSLQGTASIAVSSSYALSSSYAVSSSRAVSSSYAISSSRAVSSSYALTSTTATSADSVSPVSYDNGGGVTQATFNFVAGRVALTSGVGSSSVFSELTGKNIGDRSFITATYAAGFTFATPTAPANLIVNVTGDGRVAIIQQQGATDSGNVIFTGMYF
jgi:hypothetical protein